MTTVIQEKEPVLRDGQVNLVDYYEQRQGMYQQELDAAKAKKSELEEACTQLARQLKDAEKKTWDLQSAKAQSETLGLATNEIVLLLERSEADAQSLRKEIEKKKAEMNAIAVPQPPVSFETRIKAAKALAEIGHIGATKVGSTLEALRHFTKNLRARAKTAHSNGHRRADVQAARCISFELDDHAHPTNARLSLAGGLVLDVTLAGTDAYFVPGAFPSELRWIPRATSSEESTSDDSVLTNRELFINTVTDELILSRDVSDERWDQDVEYTECHQNSYDRGSYRTTRPGYKTTENRELIEKNTVAIWDELAREAKVIAAGAADAKSRRGSHTPIPLDLGKPYDNDPLLGHIKAILVSHLATNPTLELFTENLTTDRAYAAIEQDWSLLAAAPWSDAIRGSLAKLKIYLEDRDETRVWCKRYKGHYGFRLRTRDHSWIAGELFVDQSREPGKPGDLIKVHSFYETQASVSIGRMSLRLEESRDQR